MRIRRSRTYTVNLQKTAFSWSLEFITCLIWGFVAIRSHDPETDVDLITGLVIVDAFFSFIIIPSIYLFFSYIWNNEITQSLVVAEGWFRSFQCCKRSNKVIPDVNEGTEEIAAYPCQPLRIQTVSENISSLEKQHIEGFIHKEDLEKKYKMLVSNHLFYDPQKNHNLCPLSVRKLGYSSQ